MLFIIDPYFIELDFIPYFNFSLHFYSYSNFLILNELNIDISTFLNSAVGMGRQISKFKI